MKGLSLLRFLPLDNTGHRNVASFVFVFSDRCFLVQSAMDTTDLSPKNLANILVETKKELGIADKTNIER